MHPGNWVWTHLWYEAYANTTAVAVLSLTLGVQVNVRLRKIVLDTTPLLTCMYLQLHACGPYKNNYAVVEQHAGNLELLYLPSTSTRIWICRSNVDDNAGTAVYHTHIYVLQYEHRSICHFLSYSVTLLVSWVVAFMTPLGLLMLYSTSMDTR